MISAGKMQNLLVSSLRALRLLLALMIMSPTSVFANPSGGQVIAGLAAIGGGGSVVTIDQLTDRAVINWNGFSISKRTTKRPRNSARPPPKRPRRSRPSWTPELILSIRPYNIPKTRRQGLKAGKPAISCAASWSRISRMRFSRSRWALSPA